MIATIPARGRVLMGAIRWRLLLRGGFKQEKPIRLFAYEPEIKLSVLEWTVFRAMYFVLHLPGIWLVLRFGPF